jgi:formylglycine-generating enzyme
MKIFTAILVILASCAYDARFSECTVHCANASGCPDDLVCGNEGLCRSSNADETCSMILGTPPSCTGLVANCGPASNEDCCSTATPIPGGMFYRSHDMATDGMYPSTSYPATVSAFHLDKYEVTVGRFRKFVEAGGGTQVSPPIAGAGSHLRIPASGWDPSWNGVLMTDADTLIAAVKCDTTYQTWTDATGADESLPMNCVTWYEALAFCAWDGGYLPTEAEWNYAAAGGSEQRAYAWSNPPGSTAIDCSYANYDIDAPSGAYCVNGTTGGTSRVGRESPKGDGKWGQADLGGNVFGWALDWYADSPPQSCADCANLTPASYRIVKGGSFGDGGKRLRVGSRLGAIAPFARANFNGIRCAREK